MSQATEDLVYRLRKRAEIRRSIPRNDAHGRDRISDILDEAANEIERLRERVDLYAYDMDRQYDPNH